MTYLATVTHGLTNNTLECVWLTETSNGLERSKVQNFCAAQKADLLAAIGDAAIYDKYILLAGW